LIGKHKNSIVRLELCDNIESVRKARSEHILPVCSWEDPVRHSSLCHEENGKRDADAKPTGRYRPIAEVGRGNRYVSALFYAACYFISSVAVVNLRSQPQTSPGRRRGKFYHNFIRWPSSLMFALCPFVCLPSLSLSISLSLFLYPPAVTVSPFRRKLTHPRMKVRIKRPDYGGHAFVT